MYLRIYNDNTFEFESRGLERKGDVYSGMLELKNDTLYFNYNDSIPKAGDRAVLTEKSDSYFNGEYPESLMIRKNELNQE